MNVIQLLHSFTADKQVTTVALLVAADFVLGVLAAFKTKTFQVAKLKTFLKDDIVFQVLPWLVFYAFGIANTGTLVAGYGTFADIAKAFFGLIVATQVASLITSLDTLGLPIPAPVVSIAGSKTSFLTSVSSTLQTFEPTSSSAVTSGPVVNMTFHGSTIASPLVVPEPATPDPAPSPVSTPTVTKVPTPRVRKSRAKPKTTPPAA